MKKKLGNKLMLSMLLAGSCVAITPVVATNCIQNTVTNYTLQNKSLYLNERVDESLAPEENPTPENKPSFADPSKEKWNKYTTIAIVLCASMLLLVLVISLALEIWYRKKKSKKEFLPLMD